MTNKYIGQEEKMSFDGWGENEYAPFSFTIFKFIIGVFQEYLEAGKKEKKEKIISFYSKWLYMDIGLACRGLGEKIKKEDVWLAFYEYLDGGWNAESMRRDFDYVMALAIQSREINEDENGCLRCCSNEEIMERINKEWIVVNGYM